jgi:hypothetical protein
MEKQKKYKIDEEMNKLNLPKYKAALKIIPEELGISFNTFHNYRKINIGDKTDIPYESVRKLEKYFKLKEGQLINTPVEGKSLDILIRENRKKSDNQEA